MAEAKHSESVWIYLAYSFVLVNNFLIQCSYLNVDILYIRMFLILVAVSFMTFAITVGNVFLDSILFNTVFIIINIIYIIPLVKKRLPVKLSPLEERIFEKDFKKHMSRRLFKDFIQNGYIRTYADGGQICHSGDGFSGVFYTALINPNYKVVYTKQGNEYLTVKENSWIGVVEYVMLQKEKKELNALQREHNGQKKPKRAKVKWGLDAKVKETGDNIKVTDPIYEEEDEPVVIYEFNLRSLEKMFQQKDDGIFIKNALYAIWMNYVSEAMKTIDDKFMKLRGRRSAQSQPPPKKPLKNVMPDEVEGIVERVEEGEVQEEPQEENGDKGISMSKIEIQEKIRCQDNKKD